MIPKSLIVSFLALQGPGMSPSSSTKDVVLSDVTVASQQVITIAGGRSTHALADNDKTANFEDFATGAWDPTQKINGALTVDAKTEKPWVFDRQTAFPRLPTPPNKNKYLFGGHNGNTHIQLRFTDRPRQNTRVWLMYQVGGTAKTHDIETTLSLKGVVKLTQPDTLSANEWKMLTYTDWYDAFDITVNHEDASSNVLLAQVVYDDSKPKSGSVTAYSFGKRSKNLRAVEL